MRICKKLSFIICLAVLLSSVFVFSANAESIAFANGVISLYSDSGDGTKSGEEVAFIPQKYPDELYDYIYRELKNLPEEIDISEFNVSIDDIVWVYTSVYNDNPDLFYVGAYFGYSYYSDNTVAALVPVYKYTAEQLPYVMADYESRINAIVAHFDSLSDIEAVVAVNDYLATHYQYDSDGLANDPQNAIRDSYSMLIEKRGVCQGYALLFTEIMRALGVETVSVVSVSMNHQWNLVKLDDHWYHIDVTWDDPVGVPDGYTYHDYMLHSDTAMSQRLGHYDWERIDNSTEQCTDTTYDDWAWTETNTQLTPHNNKWYYVSNTEGSIDVVEISSEGKKIVCSQEESWDVWGEPGYCYTIGQSTATWWKNWMLYHSQDKLYCYDTVLGESFYLTDFDVSEGYVYYIHADDGALDYVISQNPGDFTNALHYYLDINNIQYNADVNGDGLITLSDLSILSINLLGKESDTSMANADVDGDGEVNSADALYLNQVILGISYADVIYNY